MLIFKIQDIKYKRDICYGIMLLQVRESVWCLLLSLTVPHAHTSLFLILVLIATLSWPARYQKPNTIYCCKSSLLSQSGNDTMAASQIQGQQISNLRAKT